MINVASRLLRVLVKYFLLVSSAAPAHVSGRAGRLHLRGVVMLLAAGSQIRIAAKLVWLATAVFL